MVRSPKAALEDRVVYSLTLSVEQRARLERLAEAEGLTVSQYMRWKLLRQKDVGGPTRIQHQRRAARARRDRFDFRDVLET